MEKYIKLAATVRQNPEGRAQKERGDGAEKTAAEWKPRRTKRTDNRQQSNQVEANKTLLLQQTPLSEERLARQVQSSRGDVKGFINQSGNFKSSKNVWSCSRSGSWPLLCAVVLAF